MDDIKDYVSQFSKKKMSRKEAEARTRLAHLMMFKNEETETARWVVDKIIYMTLATSNRRGIPWSTPLFCAHDSQYNFYWISSRNCVHSDNIAENHNVAFAIYDSTVPEGRGIGVYARARAGVVKGEAEIRKALKLLKARGARGLTANAKELLTGPRAVYKAVPQTIWINDLEKKNDAKLKYLRLQINLK